MTIGNVGLRDGDEVPQVYLGAPGVPPPGVAFPIRKLVAFDRVPLTRGQSKTLHVTVPLRQLQYWSASEGRWELAKGERTVSVGASSRALRLEHAVRIVN